MRTDQLTFEEQPTFERVVSGLTAAGAAAGFLQLPIDTIGRHGWPMTVSLVASAALLSAQRIRGCEETLALRTRFAGVCVAAAVGYSFGSLTAMVIALGAFAGLAFAHTPHVSNERRGLGFVAGVAGALWALWAVPLLLQWVPGLPAPLRPVVGGALSGFFLGVALVPLHVEAHADALSARLRQVRGELGGRLERTWARCHQSLAPAPGQARRQVLSLLEVNAREAERLVSQLVTVDARLVAANRKDAESQVAQLKTEAESATDALARNRLTSAAASLSDSLEALDAMERKRERLNAELKLKLANLERAALALETAQGEPAELQRLMLRLSEPAQA